ncbi:MAG: Holliday junction branch migration protein RuvA [Patescibacteria group bacterium UBA2103]
MIATMSGTVTDTKGHSIILSVVGIGFTIHMTQYDIDALHIGDEVTLYTHLALREHAVDLYGFADEKTLSFFELLLGVSGVGPRSALSITNLAPVETLMEAVAAKDISYLTRVAGVGKKMAEKVVLELKDKMPETSGAPLGEDTEILDTLIALGYKEREAKKALQSVPNTITNKDERLKAALKS